MIKLKFGKPLCRSIMAVAVMMLSLQAMARNYSFYYTYQGKTLYYNILSRNTVEVTGYSYSSAGSNYVSGDVVIPEFASTYRVIAIGEYAFAGCIGITSISIPNSVTSIGNMAFYNCSSLTSIHISNSITSIGNYAFAGCIGITSISIPNSVTSIGSAPFPNCSSLTSINVASGNTHYSSIDGVLYNYVQDALIQCPGAKTSVIIPSSVTSIGSSAFSGCSGLSSITIPNSVTSIGSYAFNGCSGLSSITIPNSVTSIESWTFQDCSGLTSVVIPNSVTSIGTLAFRRCSSLTSITIPSGVTSIKDGAFYECDNLTTLNFNAINCQLSSYNNNIDCGPFGTSITTINIGDNVQRIPNFFVYGCSSLTSVSIPTGITFIGNSAFRGCSSLTSIYIPNSVTSIGFRAFSDCSGLTSVTIPNSVTSIGNMAFYDCSGLTSVRCLAVTPPSIDNTSFYNVPSTCTLTVPCGSIGAYIGSDWNEYFAGRISEELIFEFTASANDATFGSVAISTGESCNEKIITATPNEGYEFTSWNDGNTENPRTVTITSDTTFMAIFTASGSSSLQAVNASEFAIYPNPAKNFVNMKLSSKAMVQLLDIQGRILRTYTLENDKKTLRIDLDVLPATCYYLHIISDNKVVVKKIIKNN